MRDYIEINKEDIPCSFDIVLETEEFNLLFKHNKNSDLITCTLSKNDTVLVYDEPLIYGVPLFKDVYDSDTFPCVDIVPYDESGEENAVTYENIGTKVKLTIDNEG